MITFVKFKTLICAIMLTGATFMSASAQQADNQRMEMQFVVSNGTTRVVSKLINFSLSYNKPIAAVSTDETAKSANVDDYKSCYLVISFERLDIPLLKAFTETKAKLDAEVIITDTYHKLPTRKIELKAIVMDGMNDQLTGDYSTAFMNLSCKELVVDGVKLR